MAPPADVAAFLDDAPWDGCEHGNYEFKCVGCWEAVVGQAKKADQWQQALREARGIIAALRTELATLTRKDRDDRQVFLLEQAGDIVRRLYQ